MLDWKEIVTSGIVDGCLLLLFLGVVIAILASHQVSRAFET